MFRRLLRVGAVLAVAGVVAGLAIRATGGWSRFQERIQPIIYSGPIGTFIARTYGYLNGWLYSRFARFLELRPEDEVLDVACGSGIFLRDYGADVRRIAGLDQSKPMIDEALRQNRERVEAGTAEFVVGDVAALPWGDDEFTVVTSNCVDCYDSKAQLAIEEMYRVLKPGGRAVLGEDRRDALERAGFHRITAERMLDRLVTTGYKD